MNTIPEHIQAPLRRLIYGGLPVDEIAIMMQLSEKAVKREIERIGAGRLRARIEDEPRRHAPGSLRLPISGAGRLESGRGPASSDRTGGSPASGSDRTSRLHPRHVVSKPAQAYEPEVPIEVREWIGPAPASPDLVLDAQPPAQPHSGVVVERPVRFGDGAYIEVVRPARGVRGLCRESEGLGLAARPRPLRRRRLLGRDLGAPGAAALKT